MVLTFVTILSMAMLSSAAFATIAVSSPPPLSLEPGDSARFEFQIQSTSGHGDVICKPSVDGDDVIQVNFDREEYPLVDLAAGTPNIAFVMGDIMVSADATIDNSYSSQICVVCDKDSQDSGTSTRKVLCAQSINVNVVDEVTRENPKVHDKYAIPWGTILIGLIILLIIAAIFFYHYLGKHKHERNLKIGTLEPKHIKPPITSRKKKAARRKPKKR